VSAMATVRREFPIDADAEQAWGVFRDVGNVHIRLAPGFVVDTVLDGDTRHVTFANGVAVAERIVSVDDEHRRLAYSIVGGSAAHHNASFEVRPAISGSVVCWTTDLLPDSVADTFARMMDAGIPVMQQTLAGR
jgi:carbon monoxide dehydrogenase subunit G